MSDRQSTQPGAAHAAAAVLSAAIREDFCVVVPAFNEAPVIADTVRALREAFARHELAGEVIIVDDGSSDGTARLAADAGADWAALHVVQHRRNQGKTEALLTAAAHTHKRWLVLFDADLQHLPDEIPRFLERLQEGWDIVTGRKIGAYDKKAVSTVYNRLSRSIFDVPVHDLNSMKAFRREILDEVSLRHDWHRFFVVLAQDRGWSVTEIDIELHPRRAGESKYQGRGRIMVGVLDLLAVAFLLKFSRKPMLLFGTIGVVLLTAGVATGVVAFWLRFGLGMGFRPLLYLVVLLVTVGALLFGVGFLAEMIAQLRDELDLSRGPARFGTRRIPSDDPSVRTPPAP